VIADGCVRAPHADHDSEFTGVQPDGFVVAEGDFMILPLDGRAAALAGEVRWHLAFG
jgi:hypothetical protein